MFVILTSKPGLFRTEAESGMAACETYDYVLCGRLRARFTLAQLQDGPARVRVVEEGDGAPVNVLPAKFLPHFDTIEQARTELGLLTRFGNLDALLVRHEAPAPAATPRKPDQVRITFAKRGERTVTAAANSNLLRVSLREQGGIPFKCGGGICGTCKCRIVAGRENTDAVKAKERKHLDDAQLAQGWRMACQTFVNGDIAVTW
jgi:ferredoxin